MRRDISGLKGAKELDRILKVMLMKKRTGTVLKIVVIVILAVLFLFSTPALATSVDDLISELESELTAVPDLSSAFGSVGEAQGEVSQQ